MSIFLTSLVGPTYYLKIFFYFIIIIFFLGGGGGDGGAEDRAYFVQLRVYFCL